MLSDFKKFILRGNVVDLAVGVVIGAAFGKIVTSLVENIITPIVSLAGDVPFGDLAVKKGGVPFIKYGVFINDVISFVIIAFVIFFFVVKPVNSLMARRKTEPEVESTVRDCPECLSSIPKGARRCSFCTAQVAPAA